MTFYQRKRRNIQRSREIRKSEVMSKGSLKGAHNAILNKTVHA